MNSFIGTEEKKCFARISVLSILINQVIEGYSGIDADPEFIKYLRMGRTMISKAITMRAEALDQDISDALIVEVEALKQRFEMAATIEPVSQATTAADHEEKKLLPVTLGLRNGNQIDIELPERVAVSITNEFHRLNRQQRGICASYVGNTMISVDLQEVATMAVAGLNNAGWIKSEKEFPIEVRQEPIKSDERELYKIECRCGAEYTCQMNAGRFKANCRECGVPLFADQAAVKADDAGFKATLLTNRYYVPVENGRSGYSRTNFSRSTEKTEHYTIHQPSNRDNYHDPCNPFGK